MLFYEWNTCINGVFWFLDFFLEIILGKSFFCIWGGGGGGGLIFDLDSGVCFNGWCFQKKIMGWGKCPHIPVRGNPKSYTCYTCYTKTLKLLYWLYFIMVPRYALSIWQDEVGQTLVIMLSGWPHILENSWKCLSILQCNFCISGLNIVVEKKRKFSSTSLDIFLQNFYIALEYTGISMPRLWYLNLNLV